MTPLLEFIAGNGFALAVLLAGLAVLVTALVRRRRLENRFLPVLLLGAGLVVAATGALLIPEWWALWVGVIGVTGLFVAVFVLLLTGLWSRWAGYAVAVLTLLGLGGFCLPTLGTWLWDGGRNLASMEVLEGGWLILFALVPPVFYHVARSVGLPDKKIYTLQVVSTVLQSLLLLTVAPLLVVIISEIQTHSRSLM